MKKFITLIICLISILVQSQVQTKKQKVIQILEPQTFYLNGGAKSAFGGNSRIGFKIDLPPNTLEWYYAFTTEPNENKEQNIQLENQLRLILSTTSLSNSLISLIKIPKGIGLIDVYLTDRKGYDIFFEKDFWGIWKYKSPNYNIEGSVASAKDGKVKIDDVKQGTHFLVIRNTSSREGINVKLEVVAIVEETITDMNVWDKKSKDLIFNRLKHDIKKSFPFYSNKKIEEISICMMAKLTSELKPSDLNLMAEYELKSLTQKHFSDCQTRD